jgi:hypothetical protein
MWDRPSSWRGRRHIFGLFLTLSRLAFPTMTNSSLARVIATLNPKGQHITRAKELLVIVGNANLLKVRNRPSERTLRLVEGRG